VEAFRPDFEYLKSKGYINDKEFNQLLEAHEAMTSASLPKASLVHGDYSPYHVFIQNGEVAGIIDFAVSYAGDPRKDISTMHFYLNEKQTLAFDKGYGKLASDDLMREYDLLQAAVKVEHRDKKGYKDRLPSALKILKKNLLDLSNG
jgi:aminoglycoside phosphotransferase (APT) family kinase protein